MASALPWLKPQPLDGNGEPVPGGKLYTYLAGTSTPAPSYVDSFGVTPNTNPIILDADGRADIWLAPGSYKIIFKDASDVVIWTKDNVKPADGGGGGLLDSDYVYNGYSTRFSEVFSSTGLNDTFQKILKISYTPPAISFGASGSGTIYEKGATVASTILTASVTRTSNDIDTVKIYKSPSTLLDTKTGTIPAGGTTTTTYSTPFTDTVSFYATVIDVTGGGGPTTVTSNTVTFNYVYPYYSDAGASGKTAAQVGALTKTIMTASLSVTKVMTATAGQVFYFAYPAAYSSLVSILDVNGFETLPDWTLTTANITGLDATAVSYKIYAFNNAVTAGSYQYTFKR